jgi:hypothetical protein
MGDLGSHFEAGKSILLILYQDEAQEIYEQIDSALASNCLPQVTKQCIYTV